jgi:hypothetical protein
MSLRLLNGGASPANCARKMAGPLIVFTHTSVATPTGVT